VAHLTVELAELTLKALKKRARAEGVNGDAVDALDDEDDPKAAAIEISVAAAKERWAVEAKVATTEAEADRAKAETEASLRAELAQLKLSALKKRARAEGLDEDSVDDIDDAADPKAAIIDLLVAVASM
jgi:predicted DNA binding CopG/RHH family protein